MVAIRQSMHPLGTNNGTLTASNAFSLREEQLWNGRHGFGVVAPCAMQRTPFKEYGGSYPGAIVQAATLNVEDQSQETPLQRKANRLCGSGFQAAHPLITRHIAR